MNFSEIPDIARELSKHVYLLEDRALFSDSLKVSRATMIPLDNQFDRGDITVYDYFRRVLSTWLANNGGQATLKALQKTLGDIKFQAAAESLEKFAKPGDGNNVEGKESGQKSGSSKTVEKPMFNFSNAEVRFRAADVLAADSTLIQNWERLCTKLGIPGYEAVQWKHEIRHGTTFRELMERILLTWNSSNGKNANVPRLCKILDEMNYTGVEVALQNEFGMSK